VSVREELWTRSPVISFVYKEGAIPAVVGRISGTLDLAIAIVTISRSRGERCQVLLLRIGIGISQEQYHPEGSGPKGLNTAARYSFSKSPCCRVGPRCGVVTVVPDAHHSPPPIAYTGLSRR